MYVRPLGQPKGCHSLGRITPTFGTLPGYASHSFIELYNPTDEDIDLSGYSIQYRSSSDGDNNDQWYKLDLTGGISAGGYYLIRCGEVTSTSNVKNEVPEGNIEWDVQLHNKGLSVALVSNQTQLSDDVVGDVTELESDEAAAIVDLAAVQGNDGTTAQQPYAYEGGYSAIQSKKKAIHRTDFADTDNNASDFTAVDYSSTVSEANGPHVGSYTAPVVYTPVTTTDTQYVGYENDNDASLALTEIARYNAGALCADGASSEIVAYNSDNTFAYTVNGVKGTLDVISLEGLESTESVADLEGIETDVEALVEDKDEDFTYGDMTSVAVSPDDSMIAVALQDADYTKAGRVVLFDCNEDGSLTYKSIATTGVQPDMVTFNEDGTLLLTADEGEPREGYTAEDAEDPKGSVTVITVDGMGAEVVDFTQYDDADAREALTDAGIVLKSDADASVDLEPEYIAVSGTTAYVCLQEANAIAVLDLESNRFTGIYSVGFEDYSEVAVDIDKSDGTYSAKTYENLMGIRMPDGISVYQADGKTYLVTANEGDSRAWPEEEETDSNEVKSKTSPTGSITLDSKVTWFDTTQYDGLDNNADYLFGGRSFTIFEVTDDGLSEVFDSGSDFESTTASYLPDYFNCSNDDITVEDRSGKKGPEPETVIVGEVDGTTYAFVALERIGGIMVYDVSDPENATYVNYINSRDFSGDIVDDVSPEGLKFVSADESPTGSALLLAACEVSGTVACYELKSQGGTEGGSGSEGSEGSESGSGTEDASDTASGNQTDTTTSTAANAALINKRVKATVKNSRAKLTWGAVSGADGYEVYAARSKKSYKKVKTVKSGSTSCTVKKIAGKKVRATKNYKFKFKAYKYVNGKKTYIATSYALYTAGAKTKYTNAKSLKMTCSGKKVSGKSISVSAGSTKKVKVTTTKAKSGKKLLPASLCKRVRYFSTDTSVATVSSKGTITGKKSGSCTVYAVAANGVKTSVKVNVA